jgi:UDP:flavonoid glycosyltransferase YjiC (YdhE family)
VRLLLITWDGGGNTPPMQALARELLERGHSVCVVGPGCRRASYEGLGARFEPYRHAPEHDASSPDTDIVRDWQARTPIGAFARLRDNLSSGPRGSSRLRSLRPWSASAPRPSSSTTC